jgi:hypothetical protein
VGQVGRQVKPEERGPLVACEGVPAEGHLVVACLSSKDWRFAEVKRG